MSVCSESYDSCAACSVRRRCQWWRLPLGVSQTLISGVLSLKRSQMLRWRRRFVTKTATHGMYVCVCIVVQQVECAVSTDPGLPISMHTLVVCHIVTIYVTWMALVYQ